MDFYAEQDSARRNTRLLVILFQKLNPSTMPQKHKAATPNKTLGWAGLTPHRARFVFINFEVSPSAQPVGT